MHTCDHIKTLLFSRTARFNQNVTLIKNTHTKNCRVPQKETSK